MTWHDVTRRDTRWHNVTRRDTTWRDVTWHDMTGHDVTWRDVTWRDTTWRDVTWHGMTWRDVQGRSQEIEAGGAINCAGGAEILKALLPLSSPLPTSKYHSMSIPISLILWFLSWRGRQKKKKKRKNGKNGKKEKKEKNMGEACNFSKTIKLSILAAAPLCTYNLTFWRLYPFWRRCGVRLIIRAIA